MDMTGEPTLVSPSACCTVDSVPLAISRPALAIFSGAAARSDRALPKSIGPVYGAGHI